MLDMLIQKIIDFILDLFGINTNHKKDIDKDTNNKTNIYVKRNFMTSTEMIFYNKIKELNDEYIIIPQVNLGTIIEKKTKGYRNELFKNIDFAIFSKDFKEVLLLIELNDSTHQQYKRRKRDRNLYDICKNANIKLITFYTKYPNEKNWVLNRIKNEISSQKNTKTEDTNII